MAHCLTEMLAIQLIGAIDEVNNHGVPVSQTRGDRHLCRYDCERNYF